MPAAGRAGAADQTARGDDSVRFIFAPIGLIPGHRLSFNFFNTNGEGSQPIRAQVTLYDEQGNELARSREMEVPAGKFRTFEFNCDDLTVAGCMGCGRKGAAIGAILGGAAGTGARCAASMELADNSTGKTTIYYSYPGARFIP